MQIKKLFKEFDELQNIYGDKNLDAIYGCGKTNNPDICLVFMNPTARNVASNKSWEGLKAPWIGTKNVWNMFFHLGLLNEIVVTEINSKKPTDWDHTFAKGVYREVSNNSIYITNLSKATQLDARPLPDKVFKEYLDIFKREMETIKPKVIIAFGNQVSSVLLNKNIKVGEYRKKFEELKINKRACKVFPVYYPVGQGMRNIKVAKEDIGWILKNFL